MELHDVDPNGSPETRVMTAIKSATIWKSAALSL